MNKPHKMYFNTGVRPEDRPGVPCIDYQVWRGGVLHIIYYLESKPPKGWTIKHLCNHIKEEKLYIPVVGGGMFSKYAVFVSN